jgi:ribosomal protein S3AE
MAERKKFKEVQIPLIGQSIHVLGTTTELLNKTIKLDLSRKLRGKGLTATFQIKEIEEKLVGIPKNLELVKSYVRRIMRKRADYVEDSFKASCKDVVVTIKPFLITRKRVSRAVRRNLRNTAKEFLIGYIKEKKYADVCHELIEGELQKEMLPRLKKVYPLAFCDLRIFETKEIEKLDLNDFKVDIALELEDDSEEDDSQEDDSQEDDSEEETEEETEEAEEVKKVAKKSAKKVTKKKAEEESDGKE